MSSAESRRRAEIEAKRAKLAELKKAREERTSRLLAGRATASQGASESGTPSSSRRDLDDFVASLVGAPLPGKSSTSASLASGRASRLDADGLPSSPRKSGGAYTAQSGSSEIDASDEGGIATSTGGAAGEAREPGPSRERVTRGVGTDPLSDEALAAAKQPERVYYTKEVQTSSAASRPASPSLYDPSNPDSAPIPAAMEEAIRQKVLQEQAEARERDELEKSKEEERLEREIAEGLRELTSEELNAIYGASEFSDFVEQSSKIVERALTDSYDFLKDYRMVGDRVDDDAEGRQVKCVRTFWNEKTFGSRSITDLDWSTFHPELCVASYSRSEVAASDQPDGLVAVWNVHLKERPEFLFQAQTDVLSVRFSPFHPNLVIGGTYSGQILIWDTRAKALPVLKTPLSAAGHTHPVYSIQMVGTQNAHNLITASTDGTVCSWMLDMLARPQEMLELLNPAHAKTDEVSVTCLSFPDQETTSFFVGTEEGSVYSAARYDRAGAKAGLNASEVYKGHSAPVTGLDFHPLVGPVDFSDLFLSCSMDWTTKLWRAKPASAAGGVSMQGGAGGGTAQPSVVSPIASFDEATDQVFDAKWHPQHPAVFGQVDGAGRFNLFNVNVDDERPIISTTIETSRGLNRLAWDRKDGRRAAMGGADGRVYVYDVGTLASPGEEDWIEMQKKVARMLSGGGSTAGVGVAANGTLGDGLNGSRIR